MVYCNKFSTSVDKMICKTPESLFWYKIISMDERRSIFHRPRRQAFFLIVIVLIAYLFLLEPQGEARDVLIGEGYAFVSFGRHGGLRLFSLVDPLEPIEVGGYDTPGSAERIARNGSLIYIADGAAGLRVVSLSNPRSPAPLGSTQIQGEARDLVLNWPYAYLATGYGLQVVDISNDLHPLPVQRLETPGEAQAIDFHTATIQLPGPTPDQPGETQIVGQFVIVADGAGGLQVIDVRLPISPLLVGNLDPPWQALDIKVVGHLAFVAAGENGLRIIDLSNPFEPVEIASLDTNGETVSIELLGTYALLADGEGGVSVVDVSIPTAPVPLSSLDTPGQAQALGVYGQYMYVADGFHGMRIIDISSVYGMYEAGLIETAGEASLRQLGQAGLSILRGRWETVEDKVWQTFWYIGLDLFLFLGALLFFLAFFVQFVLPVRTLEERFRAIHRLLIYTRGRHGPAIFIKDGIIRQSHKEEDRRGPGVVLLDTASAMVLRNAHAFTRSAGPGIVFTAGNEFPAGSVDLHRQVRSIGPTENEDPFKPMGEDERPEIFEQRQKRRYDTSGLTRDGVAIVPSITAIFGLNTDNAVGNSRFGYNPEAVWLAVARQGILPDEPQESQSRHLPWIWLPPHLAADLWREYLRKFTLDELFNLAEQSASSDPTGSQKTAYDIIHEMVLARLTMSEVPELDEFGRMTGSTKPSKEFRILREHGLKVYSVDISRLRIPERVEEQLINEWSKSWLQRARSEYNQVETLHAAERLVAQSQALLEYSSTASQMLSPALLNGDPAQELGGPASLRLLLQGTLKLCIREPQLQQRLTHQISALTEIIEWAEQG
jgi:hypothetical protein